MAGDAADIFAQETIRYKDTEYTLKPPGIKMRGAFVTHLEDNAIDFVRRHKKQYDTDYFPALDRLAKKGGSKSFCWGSDVCNEALNNNDTLQELAALMLSQSHSQSLEDLRKLVAEMWESPGGKSIDGTDVVLGAELVEKIWRLITRPNSPRPAAEPGQR